MKQMPCRFLALFVALSLFACSDSDNSRPPLASKPQPDNPVVEGPITGGGSEDCCRISFGGFEVDLRDTGYTPGTPLYSALSFDMAEVGYIETEYFISGTATSYLNTDELTADGLWSIMSADAAPYTSRIVVQRPIAPEDFNGTVVVEWFNVTGGIDAAPDWMQTHTELVREGYAWVGVSAQFAGVEGGGAFDLPLKGVDSERYGALSHPGDSFSYDIFSQAAQAVRRPVGIDPLDGLAVQRMIAVGQSQSAFRLTTYYNAIHPTLDLFDAYLIHSRSRYSAQLSQEPQVPVATPEVVLLREDQPEPVIMLQTETDLVKPSLDYLPARQADSDSVRLWEVAGSSHSDAYTTIKGPDDKGDDPTVADVIATKSARPPFIECPLLPINDGPGHWLAKAAISALDAWVRNGSAPSAAPRLQVDAEGTGFEQDEQGNALGGIRGPYVDAPVAVLSGLGQGAGFCDLFGTTRLFDDAELAALYPDRDAYIAAIDEATDAAVTAGFLLPADAQLIKSQARTSDIVPP